MRSPPYPMAPMARNYPHYPPPRRGLSDFEKTLLIIGTVGRVAALTHHTPYSPYYYYRYHYSPSVVVVDRPVFVETPVIIEKTVVVEQSAAAPASYGGLPTEADSIPMEGEGMYSLKMGASFEIEYMQIPGYCFMAARLMSDPVEGSPLYEFGLQAGDVITRLGGIPVDTLEVLETQEGNLEIRYIKSGSERVLLGNIYVPTEEEIMKNAEPLIAP